MESSDLLVLVVVVGFVALCVAYVRWCDRLLGPDPTAIDLDGRSEVNPARVEGHR